jgi:Big-like domain-containing protein
MMDDKELDELFTDPAHQEVVDLLKASRPATPPLDPNFRLHLRAQLMAEARKTLTPRTSRSWFPFNLTPSVLAPAMAAVAAGFIVVLGIEVYLANQPTASPVAFDVSKLNNKTNVATGEPIEIPFSGPVDQAAVEIQIEPATSFTQHWVGQTLVIVPDHQLAPNTSYTVTVKPRATLPSPNPSNPNSPKPAVAPTPAVVHFTTVRAPIPPVVPPSFRSAGVTYGFDSRLGDSGKLKILNAVWTSAGQLLVTRPGGQAGPAAVPSPSAATASGSAASTDIWLMSPIGTPIRLVGPGDNFPSAAPTGGLFSAWRQQGTRTNLEVRDLQGNLVSTAATLDGVPDRAAVWIGSDRLAYVDNGALRIVGLHAPLEAPALKVDHGSLAASPNGQFLAVQSTTGSVVLDLTPGLTQRLLDGATGFNWSAKGDLAFTIQRDTGTELYLLTGGKTSKIASSPGSQTWSDLNWAPDAASLLFAARPTAGNSTASVLMLINRDGSNPITFGPQREYSAPQWSPGGDLVLFSRRDEAGGIAFWTATSAPSGNDAAEKQALAEVEKFMQARILRDNSTAQDQLDDAGRAAYQAGTSSLFSPAGTQFDRYYPVTVQLTGSNPNKFLVGVRIFIAKSGVETSFFEEQLSLTLQAQRYLVDGVKASDTMALGHGPTVVSVQILQAPPGQQVRVRFDADLKAESVTSDTIQVKDASGQLVAARVSFDPDKHLATVTVRLRPGTYQLVVTSGVTDIHGTSLTQEYTAPLVISR